MNILFLILLALVCFAGMVFSTNKWGVTAIYTFAIGGAVNANIFHIGDYPIMLGNVVLGLDSVVYTLFVFCVFVTFIKFGKSETMKLLYSSIASIVFSAIIQFVAFWATTGNISHNVTWSLISFFTSCVATYVAIIVALMIFKILQSKKINMFINLAIALVIASLINSFIYFGVVAISNGGLASNFGMILAGSYIGKGIAIVISLISLLVLNKLEKRVKIESEKRDEKNTEN